MIELLYTPVFLCIDGDPANPPPEEFATCSEYWNATADDMQETSLKVAYGLVGSKLWRIDRIL